ncbi:MAG: branched-chain amino acid ABC transporter permease [Proteobacteria bacterium]|nr:branched-chain amino acid ABC transporter permease [Pseudomonadota bacterium]
MRFFLELRKLIFLALFIYLIIKLVIFSGLPTDYMIQITLYSFIIVLSSLGLNVIYGFTGQFSLGHAAFYGIGAYTSAYLSKVLEIESYYGLIPVIFLAGIFTAFIAYIIGGPILRLKDDFLAIATLGFGILVRVILDNSDRISEVLGGSRGFVGINKITNLELSFFITVFFIIITKNLIDSRFGLFWRAIKNDELAASSIGVNTFIAKLIAFIYGCFLAGIAGGLYAHLYTFLHPSNFDILKSIDFLIIVIIGGMGSISGTIIAGLFWVFFIEGLRIILPSEILEYRWVLIPIILILIMMIRPYGLMVKKEGY